MKTKSFWVGKELAWEITPNFGAFCIKDKDLRREVTDIEESYYVDCMRQRDIVKICGIMWRRHRQQYVEVLI